ncbi:26S PROTEASOME NON-ATPASE REGULATORY SUBUNIT 7 [Salix viminalis]|uniref:26S PROTEASOME NON-ATPASE REGULATORY SUBUNIT 7 n=1 Tax=Salix viminalis TaxID=40686 RepID=A0A9Q0TZ92_SALVM|nr:26S PROTEASOME NON-ATPASE REGULATORY SUBUNIT 7 [Salix viminalis]
MQERFLIDVFNLLPNLNVADLIKAFAVKTNDMMLVIYLSSLIRSVVALHNLINNKMLNKEHEKAEDFEARFCTYCCWKLDTGISSAWVFFGCLFFRD